jgi:hypothetical protein
MKLVSLSGKAAPAATMTLVKTVLLSDVVMIFAPGIALGAESQRRGPLATRRPTYFTPWGPSRFRASARAPRWRWSAPPKTRKERGRQ